MRVAVACGIMLSVSRYACRGRDKKSEIRREKNALPEDISGDNLTMID